MFLLNKGSGVSKVLGVVAIFLLSVAFLLALPGRAVTALAQDVVTVTIDAPTKVVEDTDFASRADITSVLDFDAGQFDVSFDNSVLRLDNVTAGLIGTTEIPVSLWNEVSPGTYRIIVNVPGVSGVSGAGYLATLHFHVIGSAGNSSSVELSNGFLNSNLGQEITATWVGDSLTVYKELTITTASIPDAVVGSAYSAVLEATGGNGSWAWSISSGSLPDGLGLSPTGQISGTPTTAGTFSFTVEVSDGNLSDSKGLTIEATSTRPKGKGRGKGGSSQGKGYGKGGRPKGS